MGGGRKGGQTEGREQTNKKARKQGQRHGEVEKARGRAEVKGELKLVVNGHTEEGASLSTCLDVDVAADGPNMTQK